MRKLFSGKFRGIPAGVLVSILLAIMVMGGVVAAVSGYTLWQGSANITVAEPIHIYYGPSADNCTTELALGNTIPSMSVFPGSCDFIYFNITSDSPDGLLIEAAVLASDPVVTHSFSEPVEGAGVVVDSSSPLEFWLQVCLDGDAPVGTYNITTSFTRDSAS